MDKIRIAFIGCGGMSSQLQQCIPMVPEFEFVATCDLVEEKAASNARRFGALRHYTDYNEMFKNEDLYAVAVVGRPEDKLHRDIGIACLQRGYHIYTEKPPATTAEGAKMLVDASVESGKTGMVGTMWRHAPAHQIAKQLMDEEAFGEACQYHTRYLAPGPRLQEAGSPFAWPFMLDQVIHPTDCMRFFMGQVSEVYATGTIDAASSTVSMSVNLRYENGGIGTMTLGTGPVLEAMVFVKGTGNQAIQVLETRRLRRYRMPTWLDAGGGYADTPTEEWDLNTACSGKTFWTNKLLKNQMFSEPVSSVLYCYGVYQKYYDKMEIPNLELHEGLPSLDKVQSLNDGKFHVIVLDDLMEYIVKSVETQNLFTKYCHHFNITAIFLTQNVFAQGPCSRTISINTHILVLFANKRDESQAMNLGKQLYPSNSKVFMEAYEDATSTVHGYLVIDCDPTSPRDLKLRTHIFPGEQTVCYLKK